MGTLRTIFAISVVLTHCWPTGEFLVGGQNAVQLFYMISGFLISFVLVERKTYATLSAFYVNRYLRLYPIYFCVAVLSLIAIVGTHQFKFVDIYRAAPAAADALLVFSNLLLFGQDWVMFAGVKDHSLVFAANFNVSDVVLFNGLLVPQAWTLGVELSFYLIAPLVLGRRRLLYLILALSICLRGCLFAIGLGAKDPWTYRFFPAELAFFTLGALAHQILLPVYRKHLGGRLPKLSTLATSLMIMVSLLYWLIPLNEILKSAILFTSFLGLIPFTFLFQERHRLDNWIGNLSYPIYIGHMLVIRAVLYGSSGLGFLRNSYVYAFVSVVGSIILAIALNAWIGEPFEKIRRRFKSAAPNRLDCYGMAVGK